MIMCPRIKFAGKAAAITLALLAMLLAFTACGTSANPTSTDEPTAETNHDAGRLVLATTTSTYDSGLLDYLLPDFEQSYGVSIDVIAVGTGQALQLGANGDADVVLVHAREREDAFVAEGHGTARYDVMYNDFVIIGPTTDPADVRESSGAVDAFQRIAASQATFVSRGDDSGTNIKELSIWAQTNVERDPAWYMSAGQGMGAVLTIADELQAYTLSDRATYLARKAEGLALDILFEGDPILFNPYGVIPVNPDKHPSVNAAVAQQFVDWIIAPETQQRIAAYEVQGQQLFYPNATPAAPPQPPNSD